MLDDLFDMTALDTDPARSERKRAMSVDSTTRRASAIQDKATGKKDVGALFDMSALDTSPKQSAAATSANVATRSTAIPTKDGFGDYAAGDFLSDTGKLVGASAIGGTLKAPKGVEDATKSVVRNTLNEEYQNTLPAYRLLTLARDSFADLVGIKSLKDTFQDKKDARIAVDKAMSGFKPEVTRDLAAYGDRVEKDIRNSVSKEGKKRLATSQITGNIFKGEIDFGDDPTLSGYALQAAGVLGSLGPVLATLLVTKSPNAAAGVGGSMAAGEASSTAREYIGKLTHDELLENSPYYKTLIDTGVDRAQAKTIVTDKAAESGALLQGMVAAVGDRITGKLLTGAYDNILAKVTPTGTGVAARFGRGAAYGAGSGLEEGVQEVTEGLASDIGIRSQIANKEIGEDSAANLILGALGGAPVGGIKGLATSGQTPSDQIGEALQQDIDSRAANQSLVNREAVRALDPNRGAIDPTATRVGENQPAAQQPTTAVSQPQTTVNSVLGGSLNEPAADAAPAPGVTTTPIPSAPPSAPIIGNENQTLVADSADGADGNLQNLTAPSALSNVPSSAETQAQNMSQLLSANSGGTVTADDLAGQLSEVDAEAEAQLAASQLVETAPEPPAVPPDRQIQVNLGNDGRRFVVFEDPMHKLLFQLGSNLAQQFTGRPQVKAAIDGLTTLLSKSMNMEPQQLRQTARAYRDSVVSGSRSVQQDATYPAPAPGSTNPILRDAINEINQEFNLTDGETVQIQEVPSNKRMSTIAKAIKQAFGTDVVWVNFGENQQITTNQGRSFGGFNGMRVRGRNAILLDANNPNFLNTLGHELTHVLETKYPDIYAKLVALARQQVPQEAQDRLRNMLAGAMQQESGRALDEQLFESELVAEMIGEQAADPNFWLQVFNASVDRTFAQDFIKSIQDIIDKLLAVMQGPQFVKDRKSLKAVREAATQAFQTWMQQEQANATETGQVEQGGVEQRQGTDGRLQAERQDRQQQPTQQTGSVEAGTGNRAGESRTGEAVEGQAPRRTDFSRRTFDDFGKPENQITNPINTNVSPQEQVQQLVKMSEQNDNMLQGVLLGLDQEFETKSKTNFKAPENIISKSQRPSLLAKKPWFTIAHIRDSFRFKTVVGDYADLSNIVSYLTQSTGVSIVKTDVDKVLVPQEWGWRIAVFDLRFPNGQLVEWYLPLREMEQAKNVRGHKLFEKWRNQDVTQLSQEQLIAMGRDLRRSRNLYQSAFDAALARANSPLSAIEASLNKVKASASGTAAQSYVSLGENLSPSFQTPSRRLATNPSENRLTNEPSGETEARGLSGAAIQPSNQIPNNTVAQGSEQTGSQSRLSREYNTDSERTPNGIVNQQNDRANPLLSTVDPEKAEGRIRRRENRKEDVGAPTNDRVVFTKPGKTFAVGRVTIQDWLGRVNDLMTTEELKDSRTWYRQLDNAFRPIFKDNVAQYALAWLLSQKRASPSKGFTDVLRAADMAAGKAEVKKAGLNQQALIDVLRGEIPQGGIGAKLLDFLDSELGRSTRTVVRDDPRGRQPAAIDVWAQRDIGFVDPTVLEYIRKEFGEDAVAQLELDGTTSGETQYEYGIDFYNDVVDYLNNTNFDGGGWTAREVQAVGWVTMQKAMGVKAEFVRDIIGANTRRISIGLAPGADSVLADKLAGKEIAPEVAQREIDYLANLAGINIVQNVNGVGAYLQWIEGAIQIDAIASPEAVADFMDMVGYAFQQTEVINTRSLASGKNMAIDILADGLTTVEQSTSFFSKFLEYGPKNKDGEPLAPGFQQIVVDGVPGIRLLNFAGKWRQTQVAEIQEALNSAAADLDVQLQDVVVNQVVLTSTKNEWKDNPDGQAYLNSLRDRGRLQEARELVRRYPPSRVDVAGDGTISWRSEGDGQTGGQPRANFSRANLTKMVEGAPDAPDGLVFGYVPPVLQAVGVQKLPLVITKDKVIKIVTPERAGRATETRVFNGREVAPRIPLTVEQLYSLPQLLADPVAVLKSSERSSTGGKGLVVVTSLKVDGYPVIVTLADKATITVIGDQQFSEIQVAEITTALPKNQSIPSGGVQMSPLNRDIAQNTLYFNKERGAQLAQGLRLSLPRLRTGPSNANIKRPEDIVKRYGDGALQFERADIPIPRIQGSRFSRTVQPTQGDRFALPGFGALRGFVRGVQNEMGRAAQVQQAVAEQGGVLTDATDIESAVHRMYGRGGSRLDDFRKKVWLPLLERAAKDQVSLDDVSLYLYARHAAEANKQVASINPLFPDGGSGMTNQEAADIINDFQQNAARFAKIKKYADQIQAITKLTQKVLVDGDIVSQDQVDAWNATYQNYVPLKTFEQVDSSGSATNAARFDLAQEFSKRRLGRSTRAGGIIENILADYEDAVVAVERNNVRKAWLKFILDNKDKKLWQVNRPVMTRAFYKNPIEEVRYRLGIQKDGKTLPVRVKGQVYHMVIEDAETRRDLEMSSVLSGTSDGFKHFFGIWSGINRTLGKLWTALSPAFVLINAIRDTQTAMINSGVEQGLGTSLKILRTLPKAAYTILRAERSGNWAGTGNMKQYYDMYKADGGKTGFLDIKQLEDRQAEVIDAYRNAQANIKNPRTYHRLVMRYLKSAEDLIMDVNGAIEGAARVAAYKAALESGKTRIEATNIAKEITVNFNRRGRWTPVMSSLYLFFNPAVQGAVRTSKAVFSKRGAIAASGLVTLGYMIALLAEGATGDDDEPYWDKPSYRTQKLKNMVFMGADGDTYTVPLPYGLGFFVNLGYAMRDLQRGKDPWKTAAFMRDSLFIHFSPLGSAENMATFVSPTIADPIYVLASGQREDGMPLMPPDYSGIKPDSERYYNSTRDTVMQRFTSWLNESTGGSPARAGAIDVSPESLNYITSYVTGGAGTFVKDIVQSIDLYANVGADAPVEKNKVPILKALYRNETGRADQSAFYENIKKAETALEEWKVASEMKDKASDSMLDRVAENRRIALLGGSVDNYKKALAALRMQDVKIQMDDTLDAKSKYEMRNEVAEKVRRIEVDFNRRFYAATDER